MGRGGSCRVTPPNKGNKMRTIAMKMVQIHLFEYSIQQFGSIQLPGSREANKKATQQLPGGAWPARLRELEMDGDSSHPGSRWLDDRDLVDEQSVFHILVEQVPHRQHQLPLGAVPSEEG